MRQSPRGAPGLDLLWSGSVSAMGWRLKVPGWGQLLLSGVLLWGAACDAQARPDDGRVVLRLERIAEGAHGRAPSADHDVRRQLLGAFDAHPRFALGQGEEAVAADFWFDARVDRAGVRTLEVALRMARPPGLPAEDGDDDTNLSAYVSLERQPPLASVKEDVGLAIDLAVSVLDARIALARGETERVEALLGADDPELVVLALEWIRENRRAEFADQVASIVAEADKRVAAAAIETLGAVGGPHHVPVILGHLDLADPGHAYRAYDALGNLGGSEAQAFLRFAVRNEEEPDRRRAAKRALARTAQVPRPSTEELDSGGVPLRGHRR